MKFVRHVAPAVLCLLFIATLFLNKNQVEARSQAGSDSPRSGFDGPAELPRTYLKTSLSETPSPGHTLVVKEGGNLQETLNRAACGDTIQLQSGTTFRGLLRLPAKPCDDAHWILIRTSAADSDLPPEGTRVTPCFAGIDALPDRPPLRCTSTKNVLAKLVFAAKGGSGPIVVENGANHYRVLGVEITRDPGGTIYNLVSTEQGGAADHLVFDRVWLHGTAADETTRGVMLTGDTYAAVIDSYFSDFKCVAVTGACVEGQAIAGGLGSHPQGPFKIVNNFLEAAGQSILLGGGPASVTPADIEIRRNYLYKPPSWRPGHSQFIGAPNGRPYIVKNLFELKNAQRVLFEGNVLDNSWGGFTQTGFAIVLTPKNQGDNTCPACQVTDVTIRYCKISHVGSGFQIGNGLSDDGAAPKAGERYSIHDVVVDDIQGNAAKGFGTFAQVSMAIGGRPGITVPPIRDLKIDHITAFPPDLLMIIGGPISDPRMDGFAFTNSIVMASDRQIGSTGGGPTRNCAGAGREGPAGILARCFVSYTFNHNAIINGGGGWPKGNDSVKKASDVGFVNYNDGKDGDYHLGSNSRLRHSGGDNKDPGADIDAVNQATAGVTGK